MNVDLKSKLKSVLNKLKESPKPTTTTTTTTKK